ncbi:hypothetical protein K9M06_00980 [Candidatus Bipolaricaulota bacterium]|nr:hypothetical protein [Candidatus Bipolaricaulota bacterium]
MSIEEGEEQGIEIEEDKAYVSNEELEKDNRQLLEGLMEKVVPAEPLFKEDREAEDGEEEENKSGMLSLPEANFLEHVNDKPLLSTTKRKEDMGFSSSKFRRIRKKLEDLDFIKDTQVNRGGRGGMIKLTALKEKGRNFLKQRGIDPHHHRGGLEHFFFVNAAQKFHQKHGWNVSREVKLGDVYADLVASKEGKDRVVEIETSDHEETVEKIHTLLNQVDQVWIATATEQLQEKFAQTLGKRLSEEEQKESVEIIRAQKFSK